MYLIPSLLSLAILIIFFSLSMLASRLIKKLADIKQVPYKRYDQVSKYFRFILSILGLVILLMVWGVDYRGLVVVASSVLALLAVALVAQWSILSNVTAGVLIFFSFPARIGDRIEVVDGSSSISGEIQEINLFQIILKDDKGHTIAYPNSLILQKPVKKTNETDTNKKTIKATIKRRLKRD